MRFSSQTTPTLTPLGVRLMTLSRNKLAHIEPPVGGRDTASALRMSVLVREAVRTAWASLEEGPSELTDWRAPTALGLETLTEEDEEEDEYDQEAAEAAWLDDVLSSFGDDASDSYDGDSAWTESTIESTVTVSQPEADDFDYDDDTIQAFTWPVWMDVDEPSHCDVGNADVTVVEVTAVDDDFSDYDTEDEDMVTSWMELDDEEFYSTDDEDENHVLPVECDDHKVSVVEPMELDLPVAIISNSVASPEKSSVSLPITSSPDLDDQPKSHQPMQRPFLVRNTAYNNYSVFGDLETVQPELRHNADSLGTESSCDDCDDCTACPALIDPGERDSVHYDSDDDDDDCPATPPLRSCEDLETTAPCKDLTLFSEGIDWNLEEALRI